MANFLYIDNSNVWIEGMHVAAVEEGLAPDIWTAHDRRITARWRVDFGRLFEFAGGQTSDVGRAVLYGSKPPPNDSLWDAARHRGFEVVVFDRNVANKEKKVDTQIVTDIVSDSFELMDPERDEITLVAGDADFVPTVERLRKRGFPFHVAFWDQAARELKETCTKFISLDPYLDHLRLQVH